jgi:hypothetical protein
VNADREWREGCLIGGHDAIRRCRLDGHDVLVLCLLLGAGLQAIDSPQPADNGDDQEQPVLCSALHQSSPSARVIGTATVGGCQTVSAWSAIWPRWAPTARFGPALRIVPPVDALEAGRRHVARKQ